MIPSAHIWSYCPKFKRSSCWTESSLNLYRNCSNSSRTPARKMRDAAKNIWQSERTISERKSREWRTTILGSAFYTVGEKKKKKTTLMWEALPLTLLRDQQLTAGWPRHYHIVLPSSSVSVAGWAPLDSIACPTVMRYRGSATPSLSLSRLPPSLALSLPLCFSR